MSSKETAVALIDKLPEEATLMDIAQEIELVAGIRRGTEELDRGEGLTAEEVRKQISQWAKSTKRSLCRQCDELQTGERILNYVNQEANDR
jgi:HSP90 family molecular chaperone